MCHGLESGLDRLDSALFVLVILSRTARSAAASGGLRSLTRSPTRTTGSQAIKADLRSVQVRWSCAVAEGWLTDYDRHQAGRQIDCREDSFEQRPERRLCR